MDEYLKRDDILDYLTIIPIDLGYREVDEIKEYIKKLPAADVRPVVLCRDCKHRPEKEDGRTMAPKDADGYTDYECPFVCEDSWYNRMPADDDYCSCGEKREES